MVAAMTRALSFAVVLGLGLIGAAAPALAQAIPDDPPAGDAGDPDGAGGETELEDDPPPIGDDSGTEENPDAPRVLGEDDPEAPATPRPRATGYPLGEVDRPITIPEFSSEIRFGVAAYPSPLDLELNLHARYGITNQAQIGVRYNIGGFYDDGKHDGDEVWNTGKTVTIDFQYLLTDWVAPRLGVPMYVDPFAIAIELGAPMKFRFGKLAIVGFEDVLAFKLQGDRWVPHPENERVNEAYAFTTSSDINEIAPDGYIRLDFGAIYQLKPNLSVTGRFGVTLDDFSGNDSASALRGQVLFSPISIVDLIGRIGFDRLDDASETFSVNAAIAVRI